MSICNCPHAEAPRERLLGLGPAALTDAELLAVLLRQGVAGQSVLDLAREVLSRFGGCAGVLAASTAEIRLVRGMGPAKAAELKAVLELTRRALLEEISAKDALTSPNAVRDYLRLYLSALPHEAFMALFLDSQHRLLCADELFRGTLAQTSVYPREVVKAALQHNAAGAILYHNHPSGIAEPSRADDMLTRELKTALALVNVKVLDHFIVTAGETMSFAERGQI